MEEKWERERKKRDIPWSVSVAAHQKTQGAAWMGRNPDPATFHIEQAHIHAFQGSYLMLGLSVPVWVLLTSHSPWGPDVQLDYTAQQLARNYWGTGGKKKYSSKNPEKQFVRNEVQIYSWWTLYVTNGNLNRRLQAGTGSNCTASKSELALYLSNSVQQGSIWFPISSDQLHKI